MDSTEPGSEAHHRPARGPTRAGVSRPGDTGHARAGTTHTVPETSGLSVPGRRVPTLTDLAVLLALVLVIAVSWRGLPGDGAAPDFADRAHQALARQLGGCTALDRRCEGKRL